MGYLPKPISALLLIALFCSFTESFAATNEAQAELVRIQTELERLTNRNAWKGVERAYQDLLKLDVPLRPADHLAGEQAARIRGDINAAYERLAAAVEGVETVGEDTDPAISDAFVRKESIENRYGRVEIEVKAGRIPALVRFEWPFPREERVCIELGRTELAKNRNYSGFLPIGKYMVDGHFFEVKADGTVQNLVIETRSK